MKFDRRFFSNLLVFVLLIVIAGVITMCTSSTAIKIAFGDEILGIHAVKYGMNIAYKDVESVELVEEPDLGSVSDGKNRPEIRTGLWENTTWGEYHLCFNPNATNCIVVRTHDGRIFVFNNNTNEATAEVFAQLKTYIS